MTYTVLNKMKNEGWQLRFSASGGRLEEAVSNYKNLGFEVKTIPMKELSGEACSICFDDDSDDSAMIFTKRAANVGEDELFDN